MNDLIFGLDFGTTNSLAALVIGNKVRTLTNEADDKPHPSVVWYRGSDVIVGREARKHLESLESGIAHGFVRSPKVTLRREGLVHIEGRAVDPADIVSQVLRHVRESAAHRHRQSYDISRAVMTIPVDFAGPQRRVLRSAARKAGIGVLQFVHEPAAALYAYVRAKPDFNRELAQLENRVVLVFDWGGGTLDLTVCRVLGGVVMQIANSGNSDIGGDRFDERLRNRIRDKHAAQHQISDIYALEQPGATASLLTQCELAKIALSTQEKFTVIAKDYLRGDGRERNLAVDLTRQELEYLSRDLVNRGLADIDRLLDEARLDRSDIELCIATGGMVNMPAIWSGLVERFGTRVPALPNRDRIIAEGAAWIAHDNLRLTLSKPIEVLVADGTGRGTYLPLVDAGLTLPVENETIAADNRRFFCIDPRDGMATFEFAKPRKVGLLQPTDERATLSSLNLPVDPGARPFLERLELQVQIDHDYVAHVSLRSKLRGKAVEAEFHELDFGLALPTNEADTETPDEEGETGQGGGEQEMNQQQEGEHTSTHRPKIALRSNISDIEKWRLVPGDIVKTWKPNFLIKDSKEPTDLQREEEMYYTKCVYCHRTEYKIRTQGAIDACYRYRCGVERTLTSVNRQEAVNKPDGPPNEI
jgi:molecular chaperone DnaK (HSP70)